MKFRICAALALAATSIAGAPAALAADYDPPVFIEEAPEYVPVEIGSGWYLRGDVAYLPEKSYKHIDIDVAGFGFSRREKPSFASLGFGYHFNDNLRGDINLGWLPGSKAEVWGGTDDSNLSARVKSSAWTAMVNGYVDLGTYVGITPYIGAGIGVMQSRNSGSATYTDDTGTLSASGKENKYNFAYSLNAGAAYQITDNLVLDLGYQYLSAPDAKYISITDTGLALRKGVDSHQVKVGLRYDLW
ncbi:outer membrane protein [Aquamicrobium segne]|uniref:Outer membrane protein n=1 Tax=Aquamicrobium segne TaxID=469547 RepID=A0ABW0GW02_9HYPH